MRAIVDPEIKAHCPIVYQDIVRVVREMGYRIDFYRVRRELKSIRSEYLKYPVVERTHVRRANLVVTFSPYATSHKIKDWTKKFKIPLLHLEHGFFPNSVICDIGGFWGDSSLFSGIGKILDGLMDDYVMSWAEIHSRHMINHNASKRHQPDHTQEVDGDFIFLPMQNMRDRSIKLFGNGKYAHFVRAVVAFCSDIGITLAIKKHPHSYPLRGLKAQNRLFAEMRERFGNTILLVDGSIHQLCRSSRMMVNMNSGTVVDGFINGCIISHCGQSIFMQSGGVVHDNDIRRGLDKCMSMSAKNIKVMKSRQRAMLYYLYHRYLLFNTTEYSGEFSNSDKIRRQLSLSN